MHSINSPTIDFSELSFPISIDAASAYSVEAIRVLLERRGHDAKTQVFDALTVSEHAHPDYMDNPTQEQLGIIVLAFELAELPFPLKGSPMDNYKIECYVQAFTNYVHESTWFINVMTVDWQGYYDECIRQVQDEHRTCLKEKIADGTIRAVSGSTLRQLGPDGWHPSNLLLENEFTLFCGYLSIKIVFDSDSGATDKKEPEDFFQSLALLKGTEKDLALYDRFLLQDGKISGDKVVSRGGHVKEYAKELGKNARTIKGMLLRGKIKRTQDGVYVNAFTPRKTK
jgi:hypothetical protein